MNQMQTSKELSFVLCPRCLWHATYVKIQDKSCPQCSARLSMQRVVVSSVVTETMGRRR